MDEIKRLYDDGIKRNKVYTRMLHILSSNYIFRNGLEGYVKNISFIEGIIPGFNIHTLGAYDYNDKSLKLSNPVVLKTAENCEIYKSAIEKRMDLPRLQEIKIYFYLTTLFHELTHAKQHKLSNINDTMEEQMIHSVNEISNTYPDIYTKEHDLFPIEHNADIGGVVEATHFNNKYRQHIEISNSPYYHKLLDDYEAVGERIISPIEKLLINTKIKDINDVIYRSKNLDLLTRLEYGLPISLNEYRIVNDRNLLKNNMDNYRKNIKILSKVIK